MTWFIEVAPKAGNETGTDERNEGGMVIYLAPNDTETRQEFSRVAFVRRNSSNPDASFERQLSVEISKARAARDLLNSSSEGVLA